MFYRARKPSPIELDYLKLHRAEAINQLCIAISQSRAGIQRALDQIDGKPQTKKMSKRSVIGKRPDLGQFVRSGWEANCLRWLNKINKKWMYEPKAFIFEKVKHGTTSYLPDIYLPNDDIYIEIKGYLDSKSKAAIRRFKQYYPTEFTKLRAIVGRPNTAADLFFKKIGVSIYAYYNELTRDNKATIPNWE